VVPQRVEFDANRSIASSAFFARFGDSAAPTASVGGMEPCAWNRWPSEAGRRGISARGCNSNVAPV